MKVMNFMKVDICNDVKRLISSLISLELVRLLEMAEVVDVISIKVMEAIL